MSGKKIIFIVLAVTIIALILTWLFLEYIIKEYDIDRAMNTINISISSIKRILLTSLGTNNIF